jgi:pantetheine-phosphate adenylyltransferase
LAPLSSLVVDLAREVGADVIVKGLRVASDAEAELQQAQMNKKVAGIETLFIPSSSEYSFIASKYVRDFAKFGGADRVGFTVPEPVLRKLREKFSGDGVTRLRSARPRSASESRSKSEARV